MWNNQFPYFPPMMRSYGKNYDDNSCLYYEKYADTMVVALSASAG